MSEDLVPRHARPGSRPGTGRRRWLLVAGALGLVVLVALVVVVLADGDDGGGRGTDAAPGASTDTTDPVGATSTPPSRATSTTSGTATSTSSVDGRGDSSTPTFAPDGPVPPTLAPPSTPVAPGTVVPPTELPADRSAAIEALVGQGLTGAEAACIVNRAADEFGTPIVVMDPDVPTEVSSRLVEITQECLFG